MVPSLTTMRISGIIYILALKFDVISMIKHIYLIWTIYLHLILIMFDISYGIFEGNIKKVLRVAFSW